MFRASCYESIKPVSSTPHLLFRLLCRNAQNRPCLIALDLTCFAPSWHKYRPEPPIRDSSASQDDSRSLLRPKGRPPGPRDVGVGRNHHLRSRNRVKIDMWKLHPPRLVEKLHNRQVFSEIWKQLRKVELEGFHLRPRPGRPAEHIALFDAVESCGVINGHGKYFQFFAAKAHV